MVGGAKDTISNTLHRIRPATSPLINAKTDGSTYRQDMLLQLPQTMGYISCAVTGTAGI
jgi:hypothetical protein